MMSKRMARIAAATVAVLSLGACSPEWHIQQIFGGASPEATRVAHCESRLDPNAVSPGGGNHGLFQINNVHQGTFTQVTGQPWSERYHPHWNTVFAKHLYDTQGWGPWTCKP
jgi:hypothetical protein